MGRKSKYINIVFSTLLFVVFFYFLYAQIFMDSDRPENKYICEEYNGRWERITQSGLREDIEIPGACDAQRDELVVIETVLPDKIDNNRYLCFRSSKQDMKLYIDGELRQEYSTEDKRVFGKLSAVAYIFLELDGEDAGKTLRVETKTDSSYSGIFYTVYYGSPMGIWGYFFKQYGLELIVAFVTFILSMVVIIGSMAFRLCYHNKIPLEHLGWGILIASVWLITNSTFRQLIFPNISAVNDMAFLMIMLLALPYLLYMNDMQKGRYEKIYHVLEGIVIVNFLVCCILHVTELCDFTDTIGYVSFFCIVSIVWLIISIILDIINKKVKEYLFVAVGVCCVCVAAFVQIIFYFHRENSFNGVILAVGLIFLLIFSTVNTIYEIVSMDRLKQQALMASESKGRFLAHMSHEIRTPIHAIIGMDEMILRESKDTQIREYALDIKNAGQTLLALINDILDISKIESGKLEILPVDYDFSSLIHDVVNMMEMKANDKELSFHLYVDENIPSRLYGDDVRLRQILVNLLGNAIKYTEEGSVTLRVCAGIEEEYVNLSFYVEDTGIGIRSEDMEKLFAEFERIEEERNRQIEGTGLGMSISIRLLDMMESKLQVESTYGEGSVFYFTVRQKIMSEEKVGNLEQRIEKSKKFDKYKVMFTAPDARILIVDDNAVNRKVFRNLLKSTKIYIDEASSGLQCLEMLNDIKYDVIFMDHMMPDMDGVETLHRIKTMECSINKSTPIIVLTANAVTGAREMYIDEGFDDFLSKPVNPVKMEGLIMRLLSNDKIIYDKSEDTYIIEQEADIDRRLPDVEGIDWEYGKLHCKDEHILVETAEHFFETVNSEVEILQNYLTKLKNAQNDEDILSDIRIRSHSLKSSTAMVGAIYLSGTARMFEYAARDGDGETIIAVMPYFLNELKSMRNRFFEAFNNQGTENMIQNKDLMVSLLDVLSASVKDMDVDTADEIIKQLKHYSYNTEDEKCIFEQLCVSVVNLDEEQVAKHCMDLKRTLMGGE